MDTAVKKLDAKLYEIDRNTKAMQASLECEDLSIEPDTHLDLSWELEHPEQECKEAQEALQNSIEESVLATRSLEEIKNAAYSNRTFEVEIHGFVHDTRTWARVLEATRKPEWRKVMDKEKRLIEEEISRLMTDYEKTKDQISFGEAVRAGVIIEHYWPYLLVTLLGAKIGRIGYLKQIFDSERGRRAVVATIFGVLGLVVLSVMVQWIIVPDP